MSDARGQMVDWQSASSRPAGNEGGQRQGSTAQLSARDLLNNKQSCLAGCDSSQRGQMATTCRRGMRWSRRLWSGLVEGILAPGVSGRRENAAALKEKAAAKREEGWQRRARWFAGSQGSGVGALPDRGQLDTTPNGQPAAAARRGTEGAMLITSRDPNPSPARGSRVRTCLGLLVRTRFFFQGLLVQPVLFCSACVRAKERDMVSGQSRSSTTAEGATAQ